MTSLALTFTLLVTIASALAGEKLAPQVIELPRPNSGTFTFAQAEARKSEILSNLPTSKLENWKNPYMGFCVHICQDDSITVYGHGLKALPEHKEPRAKQSVADITKMAGELPLEGNPAGILVTSDLPLKDSKVMRDVMKALFVPSIQLFYARSGEETAVEIAKRVIADQSSAYTSPFVIESPSGMPKDIQLQLAGKKANDAIRSYMLGDSVPEKTRIAYAITVLAGKRMPELFEHSLELKAPYLDIRKNDQYLSDGLILATRLEEIEKSDSQK